MKFLSKYEAHAYVLMRLIFGFLMTCHGAAKLFGVLGGPKADNTLMWVAGALEFAGGLLVAIGFQTRLAAFLVSGGMAVGYFLAHPGPGFLPSHNKSEPA